MLECEVWLEVVIQAEIERLSVAVSPVLAVAASIFSDFFCAESGGPLLMAFRRAQCSEYQMVFSPEVFCDIQHIRVRIDGCRLDKSLAADIGCHQVQCPSVRQFPAADFYIFLERSPSDAMVIFPVNVCV